MILPPDIHIPAKVILVIMSGLLLAIFISFLSFKKKGKKYRKASTSEKRALESKRWLRNFRKSNKEYSTQQRFTYVRGVDCFLFEDIVLTCFKNRGYRIKRFPATRDGGYDGIVRINKDTVIIQDKRYRNHIEKKHIIDLQNLVNNDKKATKGLFVHTGKTSKPIKKLIKESDTLELLSGVDAIIDFLDGKEMILFGHTLKAG